MDSQITLPPQKNPYSDAIVRLGIFTIIQIFITLHVTIRRLADSETKRDKGFCSL